MGKVTKDPHARLLDHFGAIERRLRALERGSGATWHIVGDAGEPAFQSGWVAYGAPYAVPRFRKLPSGLVVVSGLAKSGTIAFPNPIFTLPVGYRPSASLIFAAASNGAFGTMYVLANGDVVPETGSSSWFSLGGMSFPAEQ